MKGRFHSSASKGGMTLTEILISLGIVLPALLIAISVLATAQHLSNESRERLLALNAARTTLETIKDTPLQNVPNINPAASVPAGLRNGAITIVTNPVNLNGVQVATVTVTVTWTGSRNFQRSLQISTMRSRY